MDREPPTQQSSWPSIADLMGADERSHVGLLGAPLGLGSVTPGRCDLAPRRVRETLRRISSYDIESELDLAGHAVFDVGDVDCARLWPAEAFAPIRDAVAATTARHALTLLLGGNNAVTRPAAHGLGAPLAEVGLITLDAHFDLRDTDGGPMNGNPVAMLLEDGLPGANICQIGLAAFGNTRRMHQTARAAGIGVFTRGEVGRRGLDTILTDALARIGHCRAIMVDFDIDVIDRAQMPGAPGARPGGIAVEQFFAAARRLAAEPRVKLVDLTEFDPSIDVADIGALTAARWVAEILAGFVSGNRANGG